MKGSSVRDSCQSPSDRRGLGPKSSADGRRFACLHPKTERYYMDKFYSENGHFWSRTDDHYPICQYFRVIAHSPDEQDHWGYTLEFLDPAGKMTQVRVPAEMLHDRPRKLAKLLD